MSESLKQRVITAVVMGVPILILLFINNMTRLLFVSFLGLLLLFEFVHLFYKDKNNLIKIVFFLMLGAAVFLSAYYFPQHEKWYLGLALLYSGVLLLDLFLKTGKPLFKIPWFFGLMYIILPLSILVFQKGHDYFPVLLFGVLILSWVSDISAYFVGKSIGKHKLMPSVSPGKTWEGFLGAGMIVMITSYIISSFENSLAFNIWILIGLTVWLTGSAGDLVESKIKRQMALKDSGTILPGHGGFLDRFDGFYFCIPFVILIIKLFH